MSAEAIARLREAVRVFDLDSTEHDPIVSFNDLRALLDAHAEAVDTLDAVMTVVDGKERGGAGQVADAYSAAFAVLAKAGHR